MGRFKVIVSAAVATVVMSATYAAAQSAVLPDRMTFVTISAPVSVPGMVLPAGEYMFRLADTQASRNVIQIYDKDRSKLFATLITVSAERNEPSDESVITFRETPSDQPPALRYWYYAGEKGGQEFAYPKDQAIRIARASRQPVMAIDATGDMDAMAKGEMHRIDGNSPEMAAAQPAEPQAAAPVTPAAEPQAAAPTPAPAEQPAPTPAEPASPTPTEPAAPVAPTSAAPAPAPAVTPAEPPAEPTAAPVERPTEPQAAATTGRDAAPAPAGTSGRAEASAAATDSARELPRTASELPFVVFMGFLALGAAFGMRALRLSR